MPAAESLTPRQAEVVIVGAGVVGCSVAYQLAKRGRQVLVLERREICSGASGRNGGLMGAGFGLLAGAGQAVQAITGENLRLLRDELPRELEDDFSLRLTGGLDIATSDDEWADLAATTAAARDAGLAATLLDRAQLRVLLPVISDRALGARFSPDHGHLWPFQLVHALARGARRYGARFQTHTPVLRIIHRNGRVEAVETPQGTVEADLVVLTTNAWAPELLPDLPAGAIVPARGQILVSEPVEPVLPYPFSTNFDKEYGRQTPTGQILFGGYRRLDRHEGLGQTDEQVALPVLEGIATGLTQLFPSLAGIGLLRAWAGIMGFTADGLPLIGKWDCRGLYVAAGFNGGGLSWGAAVGKALAQLICQGRPALDLEPFDPRRFAGSELRWENPFTAGEHSNPRPSHDRTA